MPVEIVSETHSITEGNERGVATGWLPGRLSDRGRRSAAAVGARRLDPGLAAVLVSDLRRAAQTAQIAFGGGPIPIHEDPRLRECDDGRRGGAPVAAVTAVRAQHIDQPPCSERVAGGQSYRDVLAATRGFLQDLAAGWDGRRVLVVAHSANRWALDCLLTGAALEDLVGAPFEWQEGWTYTLPAGWAAAPGGPPPADEGGGDGGRAA